MKRLVAVLFVLPMAVLACSDDDGGERPTEGVEADVAEAVQAYFDAFVAGDAAAARSYLSARCNADLVDPGFSDLVAATAEQYPDLTIESWEKVEVDGDTATVEYETAEEAVNQGEIRWINEDGWKYDACP